jgi:hypothetical protein
MRCAGTPASRARPTSRRCSTCCPATCRCRTRAARDLAALPRPHRSRNQKGFWRNADAYLVSLLKEYWGDAATAENDYCFDYLPRINGDHGTYRTVMDMIDGKVSSATSCSARTRPSARPTAGCSGWAWPTSTGWSSATWS